MGGGWRLWRLGEEERECLFGLLLFSPAVDCGREDWWLVVSVRDAPPLAKTGCVEARFRGSFLVAMSNSGKVMKKRQPKVVPKKAPSTDWKRLLGGV